MKVIIDIDKEEYEICKKNQGASYISAYNKIRCSIPLKKELKKLKKRNT